MRDGPATKELVGVACRVPLTAAATKQRRVNRAKHALSILYPYINVVFHRSH